MCKWQLLLLIVEKFEKCGFAIDEVREREEEDCLHVYWVMSAWLRVLKQKLFPQSLGGMFFDSLLHP